MERRHLAYALSAFSVLTVSIAAVVHRASTSKLEREILQERFTLGRLANQTAWQPCALADSGALVPVSRCAPANSATRRSAELAPRVNRVWQRLRADSTPKAARVKALLELRFPGGARAGVDRAVTILEQAVASNPDDPTALNDLAVAYLVRAERDQMVRPLLAALELVERALERDSSSTPALFNRALLLERLYLRSNAQRAWRRYLSVERSDDWRREAESHARETQRVLEDEARLGLADSLIERPAWDWTDMAPRVVRSPQRARELSFQLLRRWGQAIEAGDASAALQHLTRARGIAQRLDSLGADASVALALVAIDRVANDKARTRSLARGHIAYIDGVDLQSTAAFDDAVRVLDAAARAFLSGGSPMESWADVYAGAAELYRGRYEAADARLQSVQARAARTQPSLLGKADWLRGVSQLRQGAYEKANAYYRRAVPLYRSAREAENSGAVAYLLTEGLSREGRRVEADAEALTALRTLSPFRRSSYLYLHLGAVSLVTRADGFGRAALAMNDEEIEVATSIGTPLVLAYAHLARGRTLLGLGRSAEARRELADAMQAVERIRPGIGQDRVRAEVTLSQSTLLAETDPRGAFAMLRPALATHRTMKADGALATTLFQASRFAHAARDDTASRAALTEAIATIERQNATYRSAEERSSFYETVERVFDAMTQLEIASGQFDSAFAYVERGRAAAWPSTRERPFRADPSATPGLDAIAKRLPPDAAFVEYALLPDRIVIWTASRRGVKHVVVSQPRDHIARLVDRFLAEIGRVDADSGSARALLFDLLIRPIAGSLGDARRMVVVSDRELTRIPLAALWDRLNGQYLVETMEVSMLPSAQFLAGGDNGSRSVARAQTALIVGNPTLDSALARGLPALPGAEREAQRIAREYSGARLLVGDDANSHLVTEMLGRSSIFHFAGHAVSNNDQPERSYLALASLRSGNDGALRAREIGAMRLSNVRLVVLSACSTLNPRPSRMGPVAGLSYSFLRAGVQGTISTLWDVSDDSGEEMLLDLHRRLVTGIPAGRALHLAQISAMRAGQARNKPPIAWAAYVLTGF